MKFALILVFFFVNILYFFSTFGNSIEIKTNYLVNKFEKARIPEIFRLMWENETTFNEANQIFRRHYGHLTVDISTVSSSSDYILIYNNILSIDHSLTEKFMKAFGSSIERLSISFNFIPIEEHREIGRIANIYCSETLIEFHGKYSKSDSFDDMEKPYLKVERARFEGIKIWGEHSMAVDKLFPAIHLMNLSNICGSIFDHQYPHLTELNIQEMQTSSELANLIEKNPNIQTLRLTDTSAEFLKITSEKLPKLKVLEFNMPGNSTWPEIHFENVTDLIIVDRFKYFKSGKIFFKKLTKFELIAFGEIEKSWIEFIGQNKELKTLNVGNTFFKDDGLLEIASKLKHLVEVKIFCSSLIKIENIEKFLDNNVQMQQVIINPWPTGSTLLYKELSEKLEKKWNITSLDKEYFHLQLTKFKEKSSSDAQSEDSQDQTLFGNVIDDSNLNPNTTSNNTSNSNTDSAASHILSISILKFTLLIVVAKLFVL